MERRYVSEELFGYLCREYQTESDGKEALQNLAMIGVKKQSHRERLVELWEQREAAAEAAAAAGPKAQERTQTQETEQEQAEGGATYALTSGSTLVSTEAAGALPDPFETVMVASAADRWCARPKAEACTVQDAVAWCEQRRWYKRSPELRVSEFLE